ncbi:hypothetical protein NW765_017740 [Fusarium oxysporum]|nr:hypothetical protein NW765_017740 [Fusarium oxysporum]
MAQTTASGPLGDTNELFGKAKDEFLSVLSPEEAATFTSWTGQTTPDVLIEEAKRIAELFKDKSRSFRVYAQVSSFGESIRPYFEVLGIVVSSHPEWAAIAWGALRLILQLASNYTSFFEKLTDLLAEVGRIVPRFKDLAELVCDHSLASQRVKAAIQGFYTDLFALYQAVALVFTKKSGKRKKTHQVIGHLMWTPFESRFQNIVSKIKHHGKAIEDELHILTLRRFVEIQNTLSHQTQTTTKIKDDVHGQIRSAEEVRRAIDDLNEAIKNQSLALTQHLAEYRQLQETQNSRSGRSRDEIINFLDPPGDFAQELEDASRLRDPGSGTWVFSEPDFVEWMTSNSAATLWIRGKPGCGKSILASGIIDNLADLATRDERPQIFYFFFTMRNPRLQSTDHACRAILSQILDRNYSEHRILRAFDYAMSKRKDGQVKATSGIIWDLLAMAFEALPRSFLVLDGIDECVIPNAINIQEHDHLLVRFLDSLQSDLRKSRTKILFLSRPSIRQMGPLMAQSHIRSIHITPELNGVDLRRYCTTRLQSLVSEGLLPVQTPGDLEELTDTFLIGADGMFLWARLMFSYLRSPYLAPNHYFAATIRLSNIKRLRYPETLDTMYTRILDLIGRLDPQMRRQARRTFCWLLFPKRHHLAAMELHEILTFSSLDGDFDEDTTRFIKEFDCQQSFSAMDESIISACSSLVELSRDAEGPFYRFIHQTAIEFFLKRYESQDVINQFSSVGRFLGEGFGPQGRSESDVYAFFLLCPTEVEMELTVACINYLRARITSGPLSGNILQTANRSHIANKYPFLTYASSFWTAHLRQTRPACAHNTYSGNLGDLEENFMGFLEARYTIMTWVEAMYLLGRPEDIFEHGPNISHWVSLSQDGSGIGLDLCHDLETLDNDWGPALREAPDHIWNDITAFFDSKFFVQTSGTRVMSLAPRGSDISPQSSKSLSSISVSDTTDSHMAILSIWPSR